MKKLFFGMIFLTVMILSVGVALAETPKYGGKLVVGMEAGATGLDPFKSPALITINHLEHIYESLFELMPDGSMTPVLAESWTVSDDGLVYTFKLKKDVKFHNGQDFSSADVKATFDHIKNPKTGAWQAKAYYKVVEKAEVVDDHTINFILSQPSAAFVTSMGYLTSLPIMCADVVGKQDLNKVVVGTGAFQMVSYSPNDKMVLKKFDNYHVKGLPYIDELELRVIQNESSRLAALRSKSADLTWFRQLQMVRTLKRVKGITAGVATPVKRVIIIINVTTAPVNNVKLRQALSLATDRDMLVRIVTQGNAEVTGPMAPNQKDFVLPLDQLDFYKPDVEKAKKLLAEAGYPDGVKIGLQVAPRFPEYVQAAQVLQSQWKQIGVELEIQQLEFGAIISNMKKKQFHGIILGFGPQLDPALHIRYASHYVARSGYTNPELEQLSLEGMRTVDYEKRYQIYKKIQQLLATEVPNLHLYAIPQRNEYWQDYLKGYESVSRGMTHHLKRAWLDK